MNQRDSSTITTTYKNDDNRVKKQKTNTITLQNENQKKKKKKNRKLEKNTTKACVHSDFPTNNISSSGPQLLQPSLLP
jgi:hypothetical protein